VLVLGGAGAFGARIAERLARAGGFEIVLAGRTPAALEKSARDLLSTTGAQARVAVLDALRITAADLSRLSPSIVINASGPFQHSDYGVARAAVAARCHYIDLADARGFVGGFRSALDAETRAAGVLAVCGASSVPGISSAVVAHHREEFAHIREIAIAISPGNSFDPGVATVRSVLGGVGQPMRVLSNGEWRTVHGWQGLQRGTFGAAGRRWLGHVDVPDLDLLPAHIAGVETVRFQAGLEIALYHLGLWAASWLVRTGVAASLEPLAGPLLAVKRRLSWLGSDCGGMTVALKGIGRDGKPKALTWLLVARRGHGPYVPTLASVAIAKRLVSGVETRRGALPCLELVSLEDLAVETQGLEICWTVS
jgi:saccharopine dehydrogenase-like NADP-dependent oxidoreductase